MTSITTVSGESINPLFVEQDFEDEVFSERQITLSGIKQRKIVYRGNINIPEGKTSPGVLEFMNGNRVYGDFYWSGSDLYCEGTLKTVDGVEIKAKFINGLLSSHGVAKHRTEKWTLEGDFWQVRTVFICNRGQMITKNGDKYFGEFDNFTLNCGRLNRANGDIYKGFFLNRFVEQVIPFSGRGRLKIKSEGSTLKGIFSWKNGKSICQGEKKYQDGTKEKGRFENQQLINGKVIDSEDGQERLFVKGGVIEARAKAVLRDRVFSEGRKTYHHGKNWETIYFGDFLNNIPYSTDKKALVVYQKTVGEEVKSSALLTARFKKGRIVGDAELIVSNKTTYSGRFHVYNQMLVCQGEKQEANLVARGRFTCFNLKHWS